MWKKNSVRSGLTFYSYITSDKEQTQNRHKLINSFNKLDSKIVTQMLKTIFFVTDAVYHMFIYHRDWQSTDLSLYKNKMDFRYFLSIILTINIVFIRCSQGDRYGEFIYVFGHSAIIGENYKFKCHQQYAHKSMALFFLQNTDVLWVHLF